MVTGLNDNEDTSAWNNFVLHSDPQAANNELRDAAIANQFMGAANNGGLNAFLTASHDLDAGAVHQALIRIGALQAAAALGRILTTLGEPLPVTTQDERWSALDRLWPKELDEFDYLPAEADAELVTKLERHVAQHHDYYLRLTE